MQVTNYKNFKECSNNNKELLKQFNWKITARLDIENKNDIQYVFSLQNENVYCIVYKKKLKELNDEFTNRN